jgi:hypothetical protein
MLNFYFYFLVGDKILHYKPYQPTIHKYSKNPQFGNKQNSNWFIGASWVFASDNSGNFSSWLC